MLVLQLIVVAPGSVALEGLGEIEPEIEPTAEKFAVTVMLLVMLVGESPVHPVNCQPDAALALSAVSLPLGIPLDGFAEAEQPAEAAAAGEMLTVTE